MRLKLITIVQFCFILNGCYKYISKILCQEIFQKDLHNTHSVIASEAKQSHNFLIFQEITTSLTRLVMTKYFLKILHALEMI